MRGFSIGQLADASGVHLETIRYYERIGLMPEPERSAGGHRCYAAEHVRRLMFIRRARELGFGIESIRTLLGLAQPGRASCDEVREIAAEHLKGVRGKLADLRRLERILAETVAKCERSVPPECPIIDMLGRPPPDRTRARPGAA